MLNVRGKRAIADVIYCYKMTLFIALDGVTSFLRLKDVTNTCKRMQNRPTIGGNYSLLEEAEDFKCAFVVYCVLESK